MGCPLGMGSGFLLQLLIFLLLLICGACTSPVAGAGCRADFTFDGDDNRRRKPTNWKEWTHTGLPDVVEATEDDYNRNDPEIWLRRAIKYGLAKANQSDLRRTFFYKARRSFAVCTKHVKDSIQIMNKNNT